MKVSGHKHGLHLNKVTGYAFIISSVCYVLSLLFPVDVSVNPPVISPWMIMFGRIQTALIILGSTALGIKFADEKKLMSSIGFTMMAIAQGVMFVIFTFTFNSNETIEEAFSLYSASLYLLVPAVFMIAFYSDFPGWVNITGIIAVCGFISDNIAFNIIGKIKMWIFVMDTAWNLLFVVAVFFWGIFILRELTDARANNKN